ncbi:DUF3883 domain-containing protein [Flavihumibacter sediminis]|nr:DUF3883 domain-containing protein [Flavihumibacter sediminis]
MTNTLLFLNTGWMDFYKGLKNDSITGGGKNVAKMGWGHEILNFKIYNKQAYGYVQPKIDKKFKNPSNIKLEKLGASKSDDKIENITVVWTATCPNRHKSFVIGWYKNATVYRYHQAPPRNSKRNFKNNQIGYFVTTKETNAKLLPKDERILEVKRRMKNWMGQSNVWYAEKNPEFVTTVKNYIFKGIIPAKNKSRQKKIGLPKQIDPLKRLEVEKKAVLMVTGYYKKLGYEVQSFEKDNVGWDLTATNNSTILKIEVKGLSGLNISTELTPNEYKNLKEDKIYYRLCIVTNALKKPKLKIFAHSTDNNEWTSDDGTILNFNEEVSARIFVK